MATSVIQQGSLVTFKASGGTVLFTPTSLASGSARQSTKYDLGATFAAQYGWQLETKFGTGPTANTLLRVFLAFSADDSIFAGEASGTDGAYSAAAHANMMELKPLVVRNVTTIQVVSDMFVPIARYMSVIWFNDGTGQALSSTAGDHLFTIFPLTDTTS